MKSSKIVFLSAITVVAGSWLANRFRIRGVPGFSGR